MESQLHKRVLKFVAGLLDSNNIYSNLCVKLALNGSGSELCKNINFICHKYRLCKHNLGKESLKLNLCHVNYIYTNAVESARAALSSSIIQDMLTRGNFTLPVRDPPYLIIAGNCQGNMKLNLKSYKWGQAPNPQK